MAKFVDINGDEWRIKITLPLLKLVRADLDIDIGQPTEFIALSNNPIDACDVLYVLCRKQCEKRGISDEEFGERLVGDYIQGAWEALERAYMDFCPGRQREALRTLMAASRETEQVAMEVIEQRLSDLTASFSSATSTEESSESIPMRSHSEN